MRHLVSALHGSLADGNGPCPADRTLSYPLTPMQMGLIYESVATNRPWINLEQVVARLTDERIDRAAMAQAWQTLAIRHDVLRTAFQRIDRDDPVQVLNPETRVLINEIDLSRHEADDQEQMIQDWLASDRDRGVDLATVPNWRVTWFLLGARASVLVWTFHHAILDGRSFAALLRQVLDHYTGSANGEDTTRSVATGPAARFADHCRAADAQDLKPAERYFRTSLAGFDTPNRIDISIGPCPVERKSGPADANGRKQIVERTLPATFGRGLRAKADATCTTVATLVLAAWGVVIARCSAQQDAVFGVTRSGRHLIPDALDSVGCLINTIPQRVSLHPTGTIDGLLASVRRDQLAVRAHEHTPLTDIARWSGVPNGVALFNSAVMFERGSLESSLRALGGVWASRRFEVIEEGALPLTLAVYQDEEMIFRLENDPEHVPRSLAERLLGYTLNVLDCFANLPGETPLADLDMLPSSESASLLALGRPDDPVGPGAEKLGCIACNFSARAAERGNRTALSTAGRPDKMSYGELERQANQLAHLLRSKFIGKGDLVAVCLPRSFDFVTALLAVMRSGAAFLPLDPSYPSAVIDRMLDDSDAALVICCSALIPQGAKDRTVLLDAEQTLPLRPDTAPEMGDPDPDRTAYMIYTSGSTGTPKGVKVSHLSLVSHIAAATRTFELDPSDRVLQFASLSFDVSIEEMLPALLCGAELVLRRAEMAESMTAFLQGVADSRITVLNLPTAFWTALVDHQDETGAALPPAVRLVVVGGETISPASLVKWQRLNPGVRWLNGYGPTETTITATVFDLARSQPLAEGEDVPIGRPMGHTKAYVLARDGSLAPWGAQGELWLGGAAVAQGYHNRPAITAERFLTDPFSVHPRTGKPVGSGRMYRTGDIARWRHDGTLDFGGRTDRQVKVNGYRIELREVEKALEANEYVGLALASVDGQGTATSRLLAWITPANNHMAPDPDRIRQELKARLPAYMVPTVVIVDAFPKTPGGKIDLRALPRPAANASRATAQDDGGENVRRLRQIYQDILSIADVGPDDSFFDLGGHSLLAVRLIGRLEREFSHLLAVSALHDAPTPRQLARALTKPHSDARPDYIVPIQPLGCRPPIFAVHVLGPNECFFRPLAMQLGSGQPLFGLSVGPLTPGAPTGVSETAELYLQSIQQHQPDGPICLAAVSQGSFIAFELAQQLLQAGRDVAVLALFDAAGPGGRARLQGSGRMRAHLRLLSQDGPRYLGTLARNRLENLRNFVEKSRIRLATRFGREPVSVPTVENFVAANTLAIEAYHARPYAGRLTVFRAQENAFDAPDAISSALGWRQVAQGGLDLIEVPGGHLSMLESPFVDTLASKLAALMDDTTVDPTVTTEGPIDAA